MAKGDANKAQNQINSQGGMAQNALNNVNTNQVPQNQALQNRYNVAADQSQGDYGNLQSGYGSFMGMANNPSTFGAAPGYAALGSGAGNTSSAGYQNFANTGGYNPGDIAAMRARAQGAIGSAYSSAQQNIERQKSLQGGFSPNYTAAQAKLTRDQGQNLSDSNINLEATLADQIRQGKLAGLSGVLNTNQANNATMLSGLAGQTGIDTSRLGANLSGLQGQTSLFGTTPGQTSMYGSQLGNSNSQQLETSQLQNAIAQMIIQGQLGKSQIPGDYQQALGNIGSTLSLGGQVAGMIPGLGSATTGLGQVGKVSNQY